MVACGSLRGQGYLWLEWLVIKYSCGWEYECNGSPNFFKRVYIRVAQSTAVTVRVLPRILESSFVRSPELLPGGGKRHIKRVKSEVNLSCGHLPGLSISAFCFARLTRSHSAPETRTISQTEQVIWRQRLTPSPILSACRPSWERDRREALTDDQYGPAQYLSSVSRANWQLKCIKLLPTIHIAVPWLYSMPVC